jgi:neutrophil cytosolic factor 2
MPPATNKTHSSLSNYEQLGLKFKLFSAEVLFNKGLSKVYMGSLQEGLMDMEEARKEKATDEHNVIDDAIQDRGEGYTVFSIVSNPSLTSYETYIHLE